MNTTKPWHLLLLSAKSQSALERASVNLSRHFTKKPRLNLEHAAYTLKVGRERFNHRKMIICRGLNDATHSMESNAPQRIFSTITKEKDRKIVFLFADYQDGSNNIERLRELYATEAVFKTEVDRCLKLHQSISGFNLSRVIFPLDAKSGNAMVASNKMIADYSVHFIVEYALAKLWMSWGVTPISMIAVGVGEYVAAVIAGVFLLEDALKLLILRTGGDSSSIHSTTTELASAASKVKPSPLQIPFIPGSSGTWISDQEIANTASYLEQIGKTSNFNLNQTLLENFAKHILLEVGFEQGLSAEIQQQCSTPIKQKLAFADLSAQCGEADAAYFALLHALGKLSLYGAAIDWNDFYHGRQARRVPLPTYSFAQESYWLLPSANHQENNAADEMVAPSKQSLPDISVKRQNPTNINARGKGYHQRPKLEDDYLAPADEIETELAAICGVLLKIENIGMDDNIIMLGADSMFTIQLSSQIAKTFSVQISPHHLFERPNLQSLAEKIKMQSPQIRARDKDFNQPNNLPATDVNFDELIGNMSEDEIDNMLSRLAQPFT